MIVKTIVVFILVQSGITVKQARYINSVDASYASQMGVELSLRKVIKLRSRKCVKGFNVWDKKLHQYQCLRQYTRLSIDLNQYIRHSYTSYFENVVGGMTAFQHTGGIGGVCVAKSSGISVVSCDPEHLLVCGLVAAHETAHNLGAQHQTIDPNGLMYPVYSNSKIESFGGARVEQSTIDGVKECLK